MCCRRALVACVVMLVGVAAVSAQEMPKPSPEHALIKKSVGTWDCKMKMMGQEMKCTHTVDAVGEFWSTGKFNGEIGGMKFEGRDINGWDPIKKKYVGVWVDSMSPNPMFMEGTYDAATKTLTMEGSGVGMEGKPVKMKELIVYKSDDEYTMTMHEEKGGKFEEIFSIDYKRKK